MPLSRSNGGQSALLIALVYAAAGFLWILLSDRAAELLFTDPATLRIVQTYKGWFYVLATAGLLHYFVRRQILRASRTREILRQQDQRIDQLLMHLPLAVQGYDEQRRVVLWNEASERLYGYQEHEALGRRLEELIIPAPMREQVVGDVSAWVDGGKAIPSGELTLTDKDRAPVEVHSSHIMVTRSDGSRNMFCLDLDLREQKQVRRELERKERELLQTLESTNDGIWDYRLDTQRFVISPRWAEMLGMRHDEVPEQGCHCLEIMHPNDRPEAERRLDDYLAGRKQTYSAEFRLRHADGEWRWIYSRGRIVERGPDGAPLRLLGAHTDITELKRTQEDLRRAKEMAENASRSKSEFLANMSHEIRTPLNGLMGMLQLLAMDGLDEENRSHVETALASGRSLLSIINDVLDFSKLDAGIMDVSQEVFDLREVLETVTGNFSILAEDKELDMEVQTLPGVTPLLLGDGGRLRQILFNLVGNALKFTEEGFVRVTVSPLPGDASTLRLLFIVRDTGIGIPEDRIDDIFGAFTQVDGSFARRYQGAGLGLGIVKRLVRLLGGGLAVESELGRGTTFYVSLPFGRPGPNQRPETPRLDRCLLQRTLRVLIAEDDRVNQILARKMVERLGHEPVCVSNGEQAVQALRNGRFDCVLMDVQMPVMDGMAATRAIRADESLGAMRRVPIVALTAHAMAGHKERFLEAGMDGYLAKPVEVDALAARLAEVAGEPC